MSILSLVEVNQAIISLVVIEWKDIKLVEIDKENLSFSAMLQ